MERPFEVHHLREHSEAVALAELEFLKLKWAHQMTNVTSAGEAKIQQPQVTEEELEVAVDNLIRLHMEGELMMRISFI